jgi:alanine dehydrogenase
VLDLATSGVARAVTENPGLMLGVNVAAGQVTYKPVADAVGMPYVPAVDVLEGLAAEAV